MTFDIILRVIIMYKTFTNPLIYIPLYLTPHYTLENKELLSFIFLYRISFIINYF